MAQLQDFRCSPYWVLRRLASGCTHNGLWRAQQRWWGTDRRGLPTCRYGVLRQKTSGARAQHLIVQLKFGGGTIRINVFPDDSRVLPKLDVELFYFFGQINMYVNFAARANLVTWHNMTRLVCQSAQHLSGMGAR